MEHLDPHRLPRHVAVIMDGNGRWAKQRGMNRVKGHQKGAESVREIVRTNRELGIPWLTLYAFSEENWKRPKHEVSALMALLKRFLKKERGEMMKNGIRFRTIGRIEKLPEDVGAFLRETEQMTASNGDMVLNLALSYGGRQEILDAVGRIAGEIEKGTLRAADVTENLFCSALYASDMPEPDLLIRTSGEFRISNFLLWEIAYTELYITSTLWPDFRKEDYLAALVDYQKRERRFGATTG